MNNNYGNNNNLGQKHNNDCNDRNVNSNEKGKVPREDDESEKEKLAEGKKQVNMIDSSGNLKLTNGFNNINMNSGKKYKEQGEDDELENSIEINIDGLSIDREDDESEK